MFRHNGSLRRFYSIVVCLLLLGLGLVACGTTGGNGGTTPTPSTVPLKVMSVDVAAGPSLDGHACGWQFT